MSEVEDIKNVVEVLQSNNEPVSLEELKSSTLGTLTESFITKRMLGANAVESVRLKTLKLLVDKLDQNTPLPDLARILQIIDECAGNDMDRVIKMAENDKVSKLIQATQMTKIVAPSGETEVPNVGQNNPMKVISNLLNGLKTIDGIVNKDGNES
jgi:hypothetical protein